MLDHIILNLCQENNLFEKLKLYNYCGEHLEIENW